MSRQSEESTTNSHEEIDVLNLPPRSVKHGQKKVERRKKEKKTGNYLFKYKIMIHLLLIFFFLLIFAVPIYYYMYLK